MLDKIFAEAEAGIEEEKEPNIEWARSGKAFAMDFIAPLSAFAIEQLNTKAAKQGAPVIPNGAYMEVSPAGWYIVCWQDETTMWEYDPSNGKTRHCGIGRDFVWTDWE